MAESVVSCLLAKLNDLLAYEAGLIHGVEMEIRSLQSQLQWIRSFLKDADGKSKENERVKIWVCQIRDVAYDAEDIIDAFILQKQHERQQDVAMGLFTKFIRPVTQCKSFHVFNRQIEEIKERIEEIWANKSKYGVEGIGGPAGEASTASMAMGYQSLKQTGMSLVEDTDVVGIDDDVKLLVHRLIKWENRRAVVSIVGMGGIGKTTLAKKVYGNGDVKRHFKSHAWITMSQAYDVRILMQRIVRGVMVLPRHEMEMVERMDVESLRDMLAEYLKERRYLIVVDDIWSMGGWDALVPAFPDGMKGSRVMLTTRNKEIALYADAQTVPHELKFLPERKCWELFCKKAFPGNVKVNCPPELGELGKEIVAKCCGLPLAIVVIGGLLSRKRKVPSEWEKVYKSISWQLRDSQNHISGIFHLSYGDLPYYLKSCFLYCGVFPEDAEISARKLIKLWIAEGFVQQRGNAMMEEVAEDYLEELILRSMIQVTKESSNGQIKTCRIHDVLRDLAVYEAKEGKFYEIYAHGESLYSREARRLVVYHNSIMPTFTCTHLRTFLTFTKDGTTSCKSNIRDILNSVTFLRVLDLEGVRLSDLPNQLGELVHLRYLGLRNTGLKNLRCSVGKLFNLQTLDIRETLCKSLPKELLKNQFLRHLCMGRCWFQVSKIVSDKPIRLPKHAELGNLRNLETLTGVVAGGWIENSLEKLTNLRRLGIGRVSDVLVRGLASSLSKLNQLHSLWLEGKAIPILELASHQSLYKMYLLGYLEKLPNLKDFPTNLTKLFLERSGLKQDPFPVLMELPKLRILGLLKGSFSGKKIHCFKGGFVELEELVIQLSELEELEVDIGSMPRLKSMSLIQCDRLLMLPEGMAYMTSLQKLNLLEMPLWITGKLAEAHGGSEFYKIEHIRSVTFGER